MDNHDMEHLDVIDGDEQLQTQASHPKTTKLCVRHQRMAHEGTNLMLQQSLDALPVQERESVNAIWSSFSASSHLRRALILQGLLTMCCFSQLSLLTEQLGQLIRIDCFSIFPREVSLRVLSYLDATSLCRAAQVSKQWRDLADDNILWRGICEQHIGQKCRKCGWGLPILERKRTTRLQHPSPCPSPGLSSLPSGKRELEDGAVIPARPIKRQRSDPPSHIPSSDSQSSIASSSNSEAPNLLLAPTSPAPPVESVTRPWKDVYSERLTIERNWRRGRCTVRTLRGHTDGVMCLQFSETLSHPSFPILITGSYDRTARVWNLETGMEVACLKGHTRAVRTLQFDEAKLITGSMDHTIRVWNWRTGKCIRTLEGHTEGVISLNYDSNVLASGSVDATVKVWNFRSGAAFTLRGHSDWVNSVQLWDPDSTATPAAASSSILMFDSTFSGGASPSSASSAPQIDPGKMLFSASDDGTIILWDLTRRTSVRQFRGHVGQVQSIKLLHVDEGCGDEIAAEIGNEAMSTPKPILPPADHPRFDSSLLTITPGSIHRISDSSIDHPTMSQASIATDPDTKGKDEATATQTITPKRRAPMLASCSLDNTMKLWDINTGKAVQTLFGHIEGVWAVASDKLRLVSGSHDRTIKVWTREDGRCTATLVGHRGAVTCLALGEDKIVSGSDDGDIRVWSFSG